MMTTTSLQGYPWQNATASLKLLLSGQETFLSTCYPWQNATASLKLVSIMWCLMIRLMLSVAKRHGLIEALGE